MIGNIARVFRNGDSIDERVGPFYRNSKLQVGLLVAAWDGSQWLQMISPGTPDQPKDRFVELADKIRQDRTLDPQPLSFDGPGLKTGCRLQELYDILEGIRGRKDFDW